MRIVLLAALGLLAIVVVAWADAPAIKNASVPLPKPGVYGKADSVEQAAGRTARRYLAPLLNKPTVLTKVSVESCRPAKPVHSRSVYKLCTVHVNGPIADCTLGVRVRLFDSGHFSARGASLRCP